MVKFWLETLLLLLLYTKTYQPPRFTIQI
jgi:hypothetical protein